MSAYGAVIVCRRQSWAGWCGDLDQQISRSAQTYDSLTGMSDLYFMNFGLSRARVVDAPLRLTRIHLLNPRKHHANSRSYKCDNRFNHKRLCG